MFCTKTHFVPTPHIYLKQYLMTVNRPATADHLGPSKFKHCYSFIADQISYQLPMTRRSKQVKFILLMLTDILLQKSLI